MRAAQAPGKVILSGEHAVLYGVPAVAMAVQRHMRVLLLNDDSDTLRWRDPLTQRTCHYTALQLQQLKQQLDQRHRAFLDGQLSIAALLEHPSELIAYTLACGFEQLPFCGGDLRIRSDLPLGAGMGSSAALIAALLRLFMPTASREALLAQVHHCERLQHGRGSLTDAAAVCYGGRIRVQGDSVTVLPTRVADGNLFWLFTGTPAASTGECVEQVRAEFAHASIWQEFAHISAAMAEAEGSVLAALIRENHRLLCRIGVVPQAVQQLVAQIEQLGGAAKVSGAGSVRGDAAGLLLVWLPEQTPAKLSLPTGSIWGELKQESQGASGYQY